ncbi:MAG: ATP-dependent Clp protease adaptor ClpS [Ktedonobacteraceae bacterium]|nr:ATP-dependent Clp protease adaptor ClpS [Ktedonobacteraceae bacterium]
MTAFVSPASVRTETLFGQSFPGISGHKVVLHRDDVHEIPYVVVALRRVVSLSEEEATIIATTAFIEGRAVVIVCPLEAAEHYKEQLAGHGLNVTVE